MSTAPEALVSVLIPARNAEATLSTCLQSVARQREPRFECVLVDDASVDTTGAIARGIALRDARFRVLTGEGRGIVPALERGLASCRAPFVARFDADDWMHRDRLRLQLDWLERHPDCAGAGTHVRLFPRRRLQDGRRAYEAWLNGLAEPDTVFRDRYVECPLAHPTWMLRREVMQHAGYRDCPWPEDYDLVLRLLESGHRLGVVPRRLHGWRDHDQRLSRQDARYGQDQFTACKADFLARGFLAGVDRYVLWGYGGTGRALRRALAEHGRLPETIVEVHPGRLGQRIHGAPVVPPEALVSLRGLPLVASVAGADARSQIRERLGTMGFQESRDFVCAA